MSTLDTDDLVRLWGESYVRVFISHTSTHKVAATRIKEQLSDYRIASFVAHEDIEPTTEWQNEIQLALRSADALVALLTEDFSDSAWTDHEVGIAIGNGVCVIPVRLECDPYGFIGKYQAIAGSLTNMSRVADKVFRAMLENDGIGNLVKGLYVDLVYDSPNWYTSNRLAKFLPSIRRLTPRQVQCLVDAYNYNDEVRLSHGFGGSGRRGFHGDLADHLTRITGDQYRSYTSHDGTVELKRDRR